MLAIRVLLPALLTLFTACSRTTSQYSDDSIAPDMPVAQGKDCPDLTGTFSIPAGSLADRILVGQRWSKQDHSLLRIESMADGNSYDFSLKMRLERFNSAAARVDANDPARYREWEELLRERIRIADAHESTDAINDRIAALGPLPEFRRIVWRAACADYWMRTDISIDAPGFSDVGDPEPGESYDTEVWLGRNLTGNLVFRIDRYHLSPFILSSHIRTGRTRHYERIEPVDPDNFDWSLDLEPVPEPIEPVSHAGVGGAAEDLSRALTNLLPHGAELSRFAPRDVAANLRDAAPNLVIDIAGMANSNADVSAFLRAVDSIPGVTRVELASLRVTDTRRVEFELALAVQLTP